jgi:hypothetical protein
MKMIAIQVFVDGGVFSGLLDCCGRLGVRLRTELKAKHYSYLTTLSFMQIICRDRFVCLDLERNTKIRRTK